MPSSAASSRCPARQLLLVVSGKWSATVLTSLQGQALGHGQLRRSLPGISQKVLTATLRSLERDGLVDRGERSPEGRVIYSLTKTGREVLIVLDTLKKWADAHMYQIEASRHSYDHQTASST